MKAIPHHITVNDRPLCVYQWLMRKLSTTTTCDYLSKAAALRGARDVRTKTRLAVKVVKGRCPTYSQANCIGT